MTDQQLDAIEAALGLPLPAEYRSVSRAFPFRPLSPTDRVYWMYDDPNAVIGATQQPLRDGDYDKSNWRASQVVIGESASGDLYLMDTAAEHAPVFLLSHETHEIIPDCPSFQAFVANWLNIQEEFRQRSADHFGGWRWCLRLGLAFAAIGLWGLLLALAGLLFFSYRVAVIVAGILATVLLFSSFFLIDRLRHR
jgi:hypothetical protein